MRHQHILKYFISILFVFLLTNSFAQIQTENTSKKDTIIYKSPYGLRIGVDISKPIIRFTNKKYKGFEVTGDYRISERLFVATELGYEEKTSIEDYTNSTAKGSYIKLGANFNTYENWLDMNNEIYLGLRYGLSLFNQTLNSYTSNTGSVYFPAPTITPNSTADLDAHWTEFVFGLKAEILKNMFVGFSLSYKIMISVKDPDNFKTLYVPGFNRVFESNTGFGFNYTISYTIPFVHLSN